MGKPKFSRKKYETPSHPWQEDRIKEENELVKKYGLKNKREIWKAQTRLKKYRSQARELLAKIDTGESQSKKESDQLLMHLNRLNILPLKSTLDDVLALDTESILSRRLQTLTYLKGLASTPTQARQLISHGHISIGEKRTTVPGYIVTKDEEGEISYMPDSPLNDTMHPARPKSDYKSVPPVKKEEKPKEEVKEKPAEKQDEKPEKQDETKKEEPKDEEKLEPETEKSTEEKTEDKPDEVTKEPEEKKEAEPTEEKSPEPKKIEEKLEEKKEEPEKEKFEEKKEEGK